MLLMATVKKQIGFTIVELLIVIIVVGILAAITVVAYKGIQNRAHDATQLVAVNNLKKELAAYSALHGSLPLQDSETNTSRSTSSGKFVTNASGSYYNKDADVAAHTAFSSAYGITLPKDALYFYGNNGIAYIAASFRGDKNIPEEARSNRLKETSQNNAWPNALVDKLYSSRSCDGPSATTPQSTTGVGSYPILINGDVRTLSASVYSSNNLTGCNGYSTFSYLRDWSAVGSETNRTSGTGIFIVRALP